MSQEEGLVRELGGTIVRGDKDPLDLVILQPLGCYLGPVLFDDLDVLFTGQLLRGGAFGVASEGNNSVLCESRGRREFFGERLGDSSTGVAGSSNDQEGRGHVVRFRASSREVMAV